MTGRIALLLHRLGIVDLRVTATDLRKLVALLATCLLCAAVALDYASAPTEDLQAGDVAPRTVKAPFAFKYADHAGYEDLRREAAESVLPVFVHRPTLTDDLSARVHGAFGEARERHEAMVAEGPIDEARRRELTELFVKRLDVHMPSSDLDALVDAGFPAATEQLVVTLLGRAMQNLIVREREALPADRRAVRIIELRAVQRVEHVLTDLDKILTPAEARQQVSLGMLESKVESSPALDAAAAVARALVRANLTFDPLQTEERRQQARAGVEVELDTVKRGEILFREGDPLTEDQVQAYRALQEVRSDKDLFKQVAAVTLFLLLLFSALYQFGSSYLAGFSTRVRDVVAAGTLLVIISLLARLTVASSDGLAAMVGYEAEARSVWYLVPVGGAAMLVRLLLGAAWSVVFSVAAATLCGLLMELQALHLVFFLISGVAAASAVEHTRERIAVLRAGVYVGVVNAAAVLMTHFVQLYLAESELSMAATMRPFWSMSFAFLGGIASSFLVLGLIPAFEAFGFVTDYRLMELANLNHPLLRQLMLRAPGSYHHSVIVGTLAEAGCEAIGANALLAKVASYFHDVGKTVKPQYFVENQRDGVNKHEGLDPHASAQIIISHVIDGLRMAKEYKLPQPILDNIAMHHGTGLLQYFFAAAVAASPRPDEVDEHEFRYPGPRPNSREAGVIMLADKVEAATRTLKNPDEVTIRMMISRIVSSVIADGQFTECPLTLQEINTVVETFVSVLVGIYHQRIEYPQTADLSRRGEAARAAPLDEVSPAAASAPRRATTREPPKHAVITLELVPTDPGTGPVESRNAAAARRTALALGGAGPGAPGRPSGTYGPDDETSEVIDYESLEHLPRGTDSL